MQKRNVILDTDISNEIDDQFALCYLMKSLENVNLQAITIAPFSKSGYSSASTTEEGAELSYNTACLVLDKLQMSEQKDIVYRGATKYFYESKKLNPASEKIMDLALTNEHTTIVAIGAITNVALALHKAPEIAKKVDIIWLGGNSFLSPLNDEFNFRQDVEGVREVFKSGAEIVVIPCRNVASNLATTIYEIEHYLKGKGEIGDYLCQIFANCKKRFEKTELDKIGQSKTLWDLSAIAYLLNPSWFTVKDVPVPEILDDTSYKIVEGERKIRFVMDLKRHNIYQDFFIKMGGIK